MSKLVEIKPCIVYSQRIFGVEDRDDNLPLQCDSEESTEIEITAPPGDKVTSGGDDEQTAQSKEASRDSGNQQQPDGSEETKLAQTESMVTDGNKPAGTQNSDERSDDGSLGGTKW